MIYIFISLIIGPQAGLRLAPDGCRRVLVVCLIRPFIPPLPGAWAEGLNRVVVAISAIIDQRAGFTIPIILRTIFCRLSLKGCRPVCIRHIDPNVANPPFSIFPSIPEYFHRFPSQFDCLLLQILHASIVPKSQKSIKKP